VESVGEGGKVPPSPPYIKMLHVFFLVGGDGGAPAMTYHHDDLVNSTESWDV
jgi:hypothetical protein